MRRPLWGFFSHGSVWYNNATVSKCRGLFEVCKAWPDYSLTVWKLGKVFFNFFDSWANCPAFEQRMHGRYAQTINLRNWLRKLKSFYQYFFFNVLVHSSFEIYKLMEKCYGRIRSFHIFGNVRPVFVQPVFVQPVLVQSFSSNLYWSKAFRPILFLSNLLSSMT